MLECLWYFAINLTLFLFYRVVIKGSISSFEKNGVLFEHEDDILELDAVIFATGYMMKLPFIEEEIYISKDGSSNLYKGVFPMEMKHPSLAFIGFVKSNGPHIPIAESQCRWAARIFAKKLSLFMKESIKSCTSSKYFINKNSNEIVVDYIDYMDDLAEEYGTKPNICSLLFKDYKLFWSCFTGPLLSYQYRLEGPNKSEYARDFILTYEQRVRDSLKTNRLKNIAL